MKILISPGYGAGWSTWQGDDMARFCLTYAPIIEAIEAGTFTDRTDPLIAKMVGDAKGQGIDSSSFYPGGADGLRVKEVDGAFRVSEYDGAEVLDIRDDSDAGWIEP